MVRCEGVERRRERVIVVTDREFAQSHYVATCGYSW